MTTGLSGNRWYSGKKLVFSWSDVSMCCRVSDLSVCTQTPTNPEEISKKHQTLPSLWLSEILTLHSQNTVYYGNPHYCLKKVVDVKLPTGTFNPMLVALVPAATATSKALLPIAKPETISWWSQMFSLKVMLKYKKKHLSVKWGKQICANATNKCLSLCLNYRAFILKSCQLGSEDCVGC